MDSDIKSLNTPFLDSVTPSEYDNTLPLLLPDFKSALSALETTVKIQTDILAQNHSHKIRVLDLGVGTGINLMPILNQTDSDLCYILDRSEVALKIAHERILKDFSGQIDVRRVVCELEGHDSKFSTILDEMSPAPNLVSACFCLNNFSGDVREKIYNNLTKKIGHHSLIIWDIFGFNNETRTQQFLEQEIIFIEEGFKSASQSDFKISTDRLSELSKYWVSHYRDENYYPSIANTGHDSEIARLLNGGYTNVDICFRSGMQVILVASNGDI